nr:hypothetical protein [Tanacetum cinerariifolium]
ELKKHIADLIQKYSLQQIPELPKKHTPTVDLEQESEKCPLEILKIKKEQAEKQKMPKFTIKSTDKDTTDANINSLLEVKIQYEVPHIQSPSMLRVPVSVISKPFVLTSVQESPSIATVTTLPHPSVSTIPPVP